MKIAFAFLAGCLAATSAFALSLPAESKVSAVTVYPDRAVVTRVASLEMTGGVVEVVLDRLPAGLAEQSIQVSGQGTGRVTILDVTTRTSFVDFTPNDRVRTLEDELANLRQQRRVGEDRVKALAAQDASLTRIESAATQPPTKEAPRLSLEEAAKLLAFLDEQRGKLASEKQSLDLQAKALVDKESAIERQLAQLRQSGGRTFKAVVVRLEAAAPGRLDLSVSYAVTGASWRPAYDARVVTAGRAVQLGYFGIVRQTTGEDWSDVALTLSTARPALGGAPTPLSPWTVDLSYPLSLPTVAQGEAPLFRQDEFKMRAEKVRAQDKSKAEGEGTERAVAAEAEVLAQVTSASFKIAAATSIPSDNSPQKVAVTSTRLALDLEYLAIPKQVLAAYLNAKVTNTSEFPFLAGALGIFLDDTFVAMGSLPTVMPGEKFDLALGADDAIAVKRKLNKRFAEDTGLVSKGRRVTYDFTLTVQNNKKTAEKIVLLDQLPVSQNEKVVVKAALPGEKELKPDGDGTLKWNLVLKPGEKREIPLKFSVEYPADVALAGIE